MPISNAHLDALGPAWVIAFGSCSLSSGTGCAKEPLRGNEFDRLSASVVSSWHTSSGDATPFGEFAFDMAARVRGQGVRVHLACKRLHEG
jgi:hypothetical protein